VKKSKHSPKKIKDTRPKIHLPFSEPNKIEPGSTQIEMDPETNAQWSEGITKAIDNGIFSKMAKSPKGQPLPINNLVKILSGLKKLTQAELCLKLVKEQEVIFFHDQNNDPFVFLKGECIPIRSKKIRQWLSRLFYLEQGKGLNSDSENQVLKVMEGWAVFDGDEVKLNNRIAEQNGAFYYDMGDHRSIKISPSGWEIVNSPILFRRYSHQKIHVDPIRGGDPWELFNFLNISDKNRLLVLVHAVSCFVPNIPHPILDIYGGQGSGKTAYFKIMKRLIDPSMVEATISPRDVGELVQVLSHHHLVLFDNLSHLDGWFSDILSQACTGSGFSKRMLYSDDDDIMYSIQRCIWVNGINLVAVKPDVLDRSILLKVERITDRSRQEEKELLSDFEKVRSAIFGGILDTVSKAMRNYGIVRLPFLFRMADFTRWGFGIAEALGRSGEDFIQAYGDNVSRQSEEVIESNTLAQAVIAFMANKEEWSGLIGEAYEILLELGKPKPKDRTFPAFPNKLRNHLRILEANLQQVGINFKIGHHTEQGTTITFQKVTKASSVSSGKSINPHNQLNILDNLTDDNPDDSLTIPKVSSAVSSGHNQSKSLETDDPDDPDDKKHTSWKRIIDMRGKDVKEVGR
jgi:hypothetical protein